MSFLCFSDTQSRAAHQISNAGTVGSPSSPPPVRAPESLLHPALRGHDEATPPPWEALLLSPRLGLLGHVFFLSRPPQHVLTRTLVLEFIDLREKGRESETSICCSTYFCIPWSLRVCVLTRDQTCSLGMSGRRSNPLSYPAKVLMRTFIRSTDDVARCLFSIYQGDYRLFLLMFYYF